MVTFNTIMDDLRIGAEVQREMELQVEKFGVQHHPAGTGCVGSEDALLFARETYEAAKSNGHLTWRDILEEEVREVYVEIEAAKLRAELIQVAAVALSWVRDIDRSAP